MELSLRLCVVSRGQRRGWRGEQRSLEEGGEPGRRPGGGGDAESRNGGLRLFIRWALWPRQVRVWRAAGCIRPRCASRAGARGRSPPLGTCAAAGWAGARIQPPPRAPSLQPPACAAARPRGVPDPPAAALLRPRPARQARLGFRLTSLCLEFAAASPGARSQFHGLWARRGARDRKPARAPPGKGTEGPTETRTSRVVGEGVCGSGGCGRRGGGAPP